MYMPLFLSWHLFCLDIQILVSVFFVWQAEVEGGRGDSRVSFCVFGFVGLLLLLLVCACVCVRVKRFWEKEREKKLENFDQNILFFLRDLELVLLLQENYMH